MPCRSAAPLVATVCPAASRPSSTVGPVQPGRRVGGHPGRLVHHHDVGVLVDHVQAGHRLRGPAPARAAAGSVTSSHSPAVHPVRLGRGARRRPAPAPSAIRSAARARDRPNMRASAASSRSPSSPSGTGTRRGSARLPSSAGPPGRRRPGRARPWLAAAAAGRAALAGRLAPSDAQAQAGQQDGQDPAADDARVGHVEHRPVRQLDPVHHVRRATGPGERSSRSPRLPVAPPSSRPSVTAQATLRSRREVRRMKTITPTAIRVNTTVIEVPMLNAAPAVPQSPAASAGRRAAGPGAGRTAWRPRRALVMMSAAQTPTATASSRPIRRGAGRRRGRAARHPAARSAPFLALLAGHAQGRPGERLQARLADRLAA